MRMNAVRRVRGIALWTWMPLVLCMFAPAAVAGDLIGTIPSLWATATATALSLTLMTVVNAKHK